jgi:predicted TIM-barrel fold metal-dependent hydrolase
LDENGNRSSGAMQIIDVWMQHPTRRFLEQPFFESLLRWTQEIISLATKFPNLFIDTSAYKASRYPEDFVAFMRGRGARKVLFGSSYPMLTASACLEGLASLGLAEETQQLFLSGNARRVFKLQGNA